MLRAIAISTATSGSYQAIIAPAVQPVAIPTTIAIPFGRRTAGSSLSPGSGLTEVDIHYVWLRAEDDDKSSRERSLEKALEKINKVRNQPRSPAESALCAGQARTPEVAIDFDRLHRRIHRISIPHATESGLFWSPDSRKLAFTAVVEGKRGTYTLDIPDDLKPKLLTAQTGTQPRWLKQGNQIVWLSSGLPASFTPGTTKPAASVSNPTPPSVAPGGDSGTGGYRFQAVQRLSI